MPLDELPNGEGWIAAALPSALYLVSQLDRQRVEIWKAALRRGTLEWQLWAERSLPVAQGVMRSCAAFCEEAGYRANRTAAYADWRGHFVV